MGQDGQMGGWVAGQARDFTAASARLASSSSSCALLPDGARLLFGGFGARDLRFGLLDGGLTFRARPRPARGLGGRCSSRAPLALPSGRAPSDRLAASGRRRVSGTGACAAVSRRLGLRTLCGCGLMPASASKPAGCSALRQPARRLGRLGRERQRFERARQRVGARLRSRWTAASRSRFADRFGDRVAVRLAGRADVGRSSFERGDLRLAHRSPLFITDRRRRARASRPGSPPTARRVGFASARTRFASSPLSDFASALRAPMKSFSGCAIQVVDFRVERGHHDIMSTLRN